MTCLFMIQLASNSDYLSILKFIEKVVVTCCSTASFNEFSIGSCAKNNLKDSTENILCSELSGVTPQFFNSFL